MNRAPSGSPNPGIIRDPKAWNLSVTAQDLPQDPYHDKWPHMSKLNATPIKAIQYKRELLSKPVHSKKLKKGYLSWRQFNPQQVQHLLKHCGEFMTRYNYMEPEWNKKNQFPTAQLSLSY